MEPHRLEDRHLPRQGHRALADLPAPGQSARRIRYRQLRLRPTRTSTSVQPDYFEGWAVAPGHIAFSHSGYELDADKTALAGRVAADQFSIVDTVTGKAVMEKAIARLSGELGEFAVMDFSDLKTPGSYAIIAGNVKTPPFRIAPNIWRDTVWKTINFFYCERCGCKIAGIHDVCHADWQAEHNGRRIVINGGWHDAGDLSQGLINTGEATHAMFTLAERIGPRDPVLARR